MKKHIETLSDWIESREVRGYYTFTKEDIEKQFPSAGKVYIKNRIVPFGRQSEDCFSLA